MLVLPAHSFLMYFIRSLRTISFLTTDVAQFTLASLPSLTQLCVLPASFLCCARFLTDHCVRRNIDCCTVILPEIVAGCPNLVYLYARF
jgi:hypothetical protein